MSILITLIILFSGISGQNPQLTEMRKLYLTAAEDEASAKKLMKITSDKKNEPLFLGYHGASQMMMAKHVGNPFKKLSYFNKGKDMYTAAINADPSNVELRFLRFSVQAEAPGFLNYKQNLEEDKKILLTFTPQLEDAELKRMILNYLAHSKGLSASEKEKLE